MTISITELVKRAHGYAFINGFYEDGITLALRPEKIALMHSELSEALEAIRKPEKRDDHLPELDPVGVELADCCIRTFDFCGAYGIDLEKCILEKMKYNQSRPWKHGKKF